MRKVIILQARLASSRFPNKVLADLEGRPMIAHIIDRLRASSADDVCVAIPADASDDALADVITGLGCCLTRGSGNDVLSRYIQAAYETKADVIVRATADNPLVDWRVIDAQLEALAADPELDYVITDELPVGVTCETFTLKTLEKLDFLARQSNDREHVTLYLRTHSGPFNVKHLKAGAELARPHVSLSVDRPEDLESMRAIYKRLHREGELIEIGDVIGLLDAEPELFRMVEAVAAA